MNIYKGKYLDNLLDFLKIEEPDFISMQEVTTNGFNFYKDKSVKLFDLIKARLKMYGFFYTDMSIAGDPSSVFGNAVLSKYRILEKNVVVLKKFRPVTLEELDGQSAFKIRPQIARHLLDAVCDLGDIKIHVMSWHGAWTAPPTDTAETLKQAKLVYEYVRSLKEPFILGCDANNIPGSKTIKLVSDSAVNLMLGKDIDQTTHPRVHKITPKGFLVDYVFCSSEFQLRSLSVPQVLVSDHLPVVCELGL